MNGNTNKPTFSLRSLMLAVTGVGIVLAVAANPSMLLPSPFILCGAAFGAVCGGAIGDRIDVALGAIFGGAAGFALWWCLPSVQ